MLEQEKHCMGTRDVEHVAWAKLDGDRASVGKAWKDRQVRSVNVNDGRGRALDVEIACLQ